MVCWFRSHAGLPAVSVSSDRCGIRQRRRHQMRSVPVGSKRARLPAQFLLFGSALVTSVCAQTAQGIIAGNVVDSTGALVDGAAVTARNVATGRTSSTVASAGTFRFPSL